MPPPPSNDNSHHFPLFNFYFFLFLSLFHSRLLIQRCLLPAPSFPLPSRPADPSSWCQNENAADNTGNDDSDTRFQRFSRFLGFLNCNPVPKRSGFDTGMERIFTAGARVAPSSGILCHQLQERRIRRRQSDRTQLNPAAQLSMDSGIVS